MNKNIIPTLFLVLMVSVPISGQESNDALLIKRMNMKEVCIGKEIKVVGGTFYSNEVIHWPGEGGSIYVQNLRTKEYYIFAQSAFESKSAGSVSDYIMTCKASTRGTSGQVRYGRNKDKYPGENRMALLIGNSNYIYDAFLKNPVNDVENVSKELLQYGFDTYLYFDCNASQMQSAITAFRNKSRNANVVLYYYAGHGVSWENRYYYLPVDVELEKESSLTSCIEGSDLLEQLQSNDRITLVLLDACRSRIKWARGANDNVHIQMEAPRNMAIVFSTNDGGYALDGDGDLSPFAEAFITSLRNKDNSFAECAININKYLDEQTGGKQNSSQSIGLTKNFYFSRKTPNPTPFSANQERESEVKTYSLSRIEEIDFSRGEAAYKTGDYDLAFRTLLPLAQNSYSDAYFYVADMYHRGLGTRKDRNEAEKWYKKAAAAGNTKAKKILIDKF